MTQHEPYSPQKEFNDGHLADYAADHDPSTHVTAGILEAYSLYTPITDSKDQNKSINTKRNQKKEPQ